MRKAPTSNLAHGLTNTITLFQQYGHHRVKVPHVWSGNAQSKPASWNNASQKGFQHKRMFVSLPRGETLLLLVKLTQHFIKKVSSFNKGFVTLHVLSRSIMTMVPCEFTEVDQYPL